MRNMVIMLTLSALLCACSNSVQTTSGTDYLNNYSREPEVLAAMDPQVRAAAEVEPVLRFPARLGLARIANGQISPIPENEAQLWMDFAAANADLGEFVPVSPLLAAFAVSDTQDAAPASTAVTNCYRYGCAVGPVEVVQAIRIGAARQHIDVVLVYEVGVSAHKNANPLAVTDLTIIGMAFVPGRDLDARGVAQAILIDVRNGYPYGTAQTVVDASRIHPAWGSDSKLLAMREDIASAVVKELIPEVQSMVTELKAGLTEQAAAD